MPEQKQGQRKAARQSRQPSSPGRSLLRGYPVHDPSAASGPDGSGLAGVASATARIATLDGWRGIAILLVVLQHLAEDRYTSRMWSRLGSFGVDIFFVLSGFIITAKLLEERERTGTISLSRFYTRRAFRILPLVVAYLAALCLLSIWVNLDLRLSDLAGSLFFFRNYQRAASGHGVYTAHFWSLSIEEHFYLIWPALLRRLSNRNALWAALTGAVACATWRLYDRLHPDSLVGRMLPGAGPGMRMLRTDVRLDGLLIGCALAILLARPAARAFILRNFPKETPLVCGMLILLNLQWTGGDTSLTNYLLIALSVASTLMVKEGLVYKWLNSRLLVGIGVISFSLYVWQQLFLLSPDGAHPIGILGVFPYNLLCALLVAACSFYCIERPTARLGRRITQESKPQLAGCAPA